MTRAHYQPFLSPTAKGAQIWRYTPDHRRPRHFHAEPEINLVVAGCARFAVGDLVTTLHPGHLLAFPPGQDHVLLDASADLDLYSFSLAPELSAEALGRDAAGMIAGPLRLRLTPAELRSLTRLCDQAWQSSNLGSSGMTDTVPAIWHVSNRLRGNQPKVHVLTRRTVELVARHPDIQREHLARLLRTSPAEASRRFHADTGMTIAEYRSRVRLLGFIRAMDQGRKHSDAAASSGFGSYSQCHRVFRDVVGCSPRAFFGGVRGEDRRAIQDAYNPLVLPQDFARSDTDFAGEPMEDSLADEVDGSRQH